METRATPLPRRWLRRVLLGELDALLCPKHGVGNLESECSREDEGWRWTPGLTCKDGKAQDL